MQKIWSSQVNKNFNEAALSYDESASIQKSTALKLAKICSHHSIKHGLWVDLGSGTGPVSYTHLTLPTTSPV